MTLSYQEAFGILKDIEETIDRDLREEMIEIAVRYARLRVDDLRSGPVVNPELGATRTRAHNALIDGLNILSRQAAQAGHSIRWRERLGDDRKVIGDFACHLHAILGLRAR